MNVHFVHVRKAVHTRTQEKMGRMLFSVLAWLPLPDVKLPYALFCAVSWAFFSCDGLRLYSSGSTLNIPVHNEQQTLTILN